MRCTCWEQRSVFSINPFEINCSKAFLQVSKVKFWFEEVQRQRSPRILEIAVKTLRNLRLNGLFRQIGGLSKYCDRKRGCKGYVTFEFWKSQWKLCGIWDLLDFSDKLEDKASIVIANTRSIAVVYCCIDEQLFPAFPATHKRTVNSLSLFCENISIMYPPRYWLFIIQFFFIFFSYFPTSIPKMYSIQWYICNRKWHRKWSMNF